MEDAEVLLNLDFQQSLKRNPDTAYATVPLHKFPGKNEADVLVNHVALLTSEPSKMREMGKPSTCKDEDSLNAESAEPHESSSSPIGKSIEHEVSLTEKSRSIGQSPLQILVTIENAVVTLLSSSGEPPELNDDSGMVSTTSLYSEKKVSLMSYQDTKQMTWVVTMLALAEKFSRLNLLIGRNSAM